MARPRPPGFFVAKQPEKPGKTGFSANTKIRFHQKALSAPPLAGDGEAHSVVPLLVRRESCNRSAKKCWGEVLIDAWPAGSTGASVIRANDTKLFWPATPAPARPRRRPVVPSRWLVRRTTKRISGCCAGCGGAAAVAAAAAALAAEPLTHRSGSCVNN